MDDKIIATFCLCDDLLKAMHHQEDRQCQMNDTEIMTTALIASLIGKYLSGVRKLDHVIAPKEGLEAQLGASSLPITFGMRALGMTRQIRDSILQRSI